MRSKPVYFRLILTLAALAGITLNSCRENTEENIYVSDYAEETRFALGFNIERYKDVSILSVNNPWQGAENVSLKYYLASHDSEIPVSLKGKKIIRTPVRSVICLSTTHISMIALIDEVKAVRAVSGIDYIYNDLLRSRIETGEVKDIGFDMNLDYERILELNPDVVFAYGIGAESNNWLDKLVRLGIDVVMVGEYLEKTPLAQTEWIRFISHFFNKEETASKIFEEISAEYEELAAMTAGNDCQPVVMSGLPWRNSWYVPGGNSHFSRLVSDAGGKYLWNEVSRRDNFPVDIESVFLMASEADFWINTGTAMTREDIINTDKRLVNLRPFIRGNLYNNNGRINYHGGNDYWESGVVNPHLVLKDLIHILNPGLLPSHELYYYRKIVQGDANKEAGL